MSARIPPGTRQQTGTVNALIARFLGVTSGTDGPPQLFTTLGRHRRLFRPWLRFAGRLMPGGKLPRSEAELVILRVATLCDCDYERAHHERIGKTAGLDDAAIARVRDGADAPGWSDRQRAILAAVDELHTTRSLGDEAWGRLRAAGLSDTELIELPMLAGHYEMLAMTLNALRVPPDRFRGQPAIVRRVLARRS